MAGYHKALYIFDFDGTLANTFCLSPNGIGVTEGYAYAIQKTFGEDAFRAFTKQGGLQNRAPTELACDMLRLEEVLLREARQSFEINSKILQADNRTLHWDDSNPTSTVAEMLVRFKLNLLEGEISKAWPMPCKGVLEFLEVLNHLNGVGLAILSSGHLRFIQKTFKCWGISSPDIIVTDDDIRWRKHPDVCSRVKPAPFPFAIVHQRWLRANGFSSMNALGSAKKARERMIYFGDDPRKDGGLAENAKVPFGWFNPENTHARDSLPNSFSFSDYRVLAEFLMRPDIQQLIASGAPTSKVFQELIQ